MKIKELPIAARPREKALRYGVTYLSNEELLAIIISKGYKGKSALEISHELILNYFTFSNLFHASYSNLISVKGISEVLALKISAISEIFNRFIQEKSGESSEISPASLFEKYRYILGDENEEKLYIIVLDKNRKIIQEKLLNYGYEALVRFNSKKIIKEIINCNGKYYYLLHNHPSGNCLPSVDDLSITMKVVNFLKRISIVMLDHLIITKNSYYSIVEKRIFNN